jgi:hypothetical protein
LRGLEILNKSTSADIWFSVVICGLANGGEILVGLDTYKQAEGHFPFEDLNPSEVKDRTLDQFLSPFKSDFKTN